MLLSKINNYIITTTSVAEEDSQSARGLSTLTEVSCPSQSETSQKPGECLTACLDFIFLYDGTQVSRGRGPDGRRPQSTLHFSRSEGEIIHSSIVQPLKKKGLIRKM